MLALRKLDARPGVALCDAADPSAAVAADQVLIEVAAAGICGSDVHIDHWAPGFRHLAPYLPLTLGHEFAGRIAAIGRNVAEFAVGDRVTARPPVTCGECSSCKAGEPERCRDRKSIGVMRDGAFARHVLVPAANCLRLPGNVSEELAALAEPLAICLDAVRSNEIAPGARVLVCGPGTIGQGIAIFARRAGADVSVAGRDDKHRFETLRHIGFERLFDVAIASDAERLRAAAGFDVVFEATGAAPVVQQCLDLLGMRGTLVIVGVHGEPVTFDAATFLRQRQQIRTSFSASADAWPQVLQALSRDPDTFTRLITHRFPLARAVEAFDLAASRRASKILLLPA
jgi:L-iditol 2-dehydrogenase/threonine 3-dehydrogenase